MDDTIEKDPESIDWSSDHIHACICLKLVVDLNTDVENTADRYQSSFILAHQMEVSAGLTHVREFYFTYTVPTHGKDRNQTDARRKTSDVIVMLQ